MKIIANNIKKKLMKPKFDTEITLSATELATLWGATGHYNSARHKTEAKRLGEEILTNQHSIYSSINSIGSTLGHYSPRNLLDKANKGLTGEVTIEFTPEELHGIYIVLSSHEHTGRLSGTDYEKHLPDLFAKIKQFVY